MEVTILAYHPLALGGGTGKDRMSQDDRSELQGVYKLDPHSQWSGQEKFASV
jgi:hypothetical protein